MLDKITFTKQLDGTLLKTVIHTEVITPDDAIREKEAIDATLANFAIGRSSNPDTQAEIDDAIAHYKTAKVAVDEVAAVAIAAQETLQDVVIKP